MTRLSCFALRGTRGVFVPQLVRSREPDDCTRKNGSFVDDNETGYPQDWPNFDFCEPALYTGEVWLCTCPSPDKMLSVQPLLLSSRNMIRGRLWREVHGGMGTAPPVNQPSGVRFAAGCVARGFFCVTIHCVVDRANAARRGRRM